MTANPQQILREQAHCARRINDLSDNHPENESTSELLSRLGEIEGWALTLSELVLLYRDTVKPPRKKGRPA